MPTKTLFLCCLLLLASAFGAQAQTNFELPRDLQLKTKEDYARHEADVIAAAKWLEETDLDKETEKRKEVNGFVIEWLSGSPTVSVELTKKLSNLYEGNPQLLGIYLASYARNYLENPGTATHFSATRVALLSMMTVYKKGITISRNKDMEKLIKLTNENKLDQYINDNFK